jgi:hypothetical protein
MWPIFFSILLVLAIQYFVPFLVFSVFTLAAQLRPPVNKSPLMFILGIAISKIGITAVFVLMFYLTRPFFQVHWFAYGLLWWFLAVSDQIGNSVGPKANLKEAMAGTVSHTIVVPLSVLVVTWLLK